MRYINLRFTYLLIYLLTYLPINVSVKIATIIHESHLCSKLLSTIKKVVALSLTSLSSTHQREPSVANLFLARDAYDKNCSGYL